MREMRDDGRVNAAGNNNVTTHRVDGMERCDLVATPPRAYILLGQSTDPGGHAGCGSFQEA